MRAAFAFPALFLGLLAVVSVFGTPLTVETIHQLRRIGSHAVNSRGDVVWSERSWQKADSGPGPVTNSLKVRLASSGAVHNLTYKLGAADFAPAFSADGNFVFFLSSRSGSSQVWYTRLKSVSEVDLVQLTDFPIDVDNFRLFMKNGQPMVLYTMEVYTDCPLADLACTATRNDAVAARGPNTWLEYDSLMNRHWDKWITPGKASHVFVQSLIQSGNKWKVDPASLKDLMPHKNVDAPVPPFGGLEQIDVSPDGSEVAYTGVTIETQEAWTTGWKIYTVNIDSGVTRCITCHFAARSTNPAYSPDGRWIAYLAMNRPGHESDKLHIERYDRTTPTLPGKTVTNLTDISFSGIIWDRESRSVIADADVSARHVLFAVDMYVNQSVPYDSPSKVLPMLTPLNGASMNLVMQPGTNNFVYQFNSMMAPTDLYVATYSFQGPKWTGVTRLTNVNEDILSKVTMQVPERLSFVGALGETVYGWVVPPYNYQPGKTYPVVNLVHGGPEGNWGDDWSYRWNPQLWSGHGYGVIMIDFHGSTSYGQNFTDSILTNWGSYPYEDIMTGVRAALEKYEWMDPDRVTACGASYGGFMVNWIQGHTTLFKALVTHDGIFDTVMAYYTTEELWFPEAEFGGTPWEKMALYQKWNPAAFVTNWKTPHLIIHGQKDYRLEVSHGLAAFTALQRQGIPSKLLYFTMENHWVLNSENGIKWYHTVLDWLDQWTK